MIQYLKLVIIILLRLVLRMFHIFPIHEKCIVFISHEGRQYSCNPKYIFEYVYKFYGKKYKYIWCLNNKKLFPGEYKNVKLVKFISLQYAWYALTSKYLISNIQIEPFFPIRKNQIVINTWHGGGAYKRTGALLPVYKTRKQYMIALRNIRAKQTTYIISACEKFTACMSKDWEISKNKFLSIGLPRNDILFSNTDGFQKKIAEYYNIKQGVKIILYAPTYRGVPRTPENFDFTLNIKEVLNAAKIRFGDEFILLYRGHHHFSFSHIPDGLILASDYPDMQELLYATNILITDYSSTMWDFSLTYKPCFIYAPDIKKYLDEQGFYTPVEEWPFMIAETNMQLIQNIINFDINKYKDAVKKHHSEMGSYETGTATEQFCKLFV